MQPISACFTVTHFLKLFSPFWLPKGKLFLGFATRRPGQRQVPLLVGHIKHNGVASLKKIVFGTAHGKKHTKIR
jgi:hypothetical protein